MTNNLPFQVKDQRKRFDIIDLGSNRTFNSCPENASEDFEVAITSSYDASKEVRLLNPRKCAELLLDWLRLIEQA
ncbi:Ff.00g011170.m01.CDS01 [Fusarium sp. VM40]|nr:Ff.00g011170.m01.CDS01 [Fusarium sp. VM40]